jgi:hypothetical protein
MRTNYVLIDLENVKPESFELLNHDHFRVIVFVGSNQARVPLEFADSLQRLGNRAEYIRMEGNGRNALDFHIAYYIGRLAVEDPSAHFHIISKDTGFDPLIKHLKTQMICSRRTKSIDDIPLVKSANSKLLSERIEIVVLRLKTYKARPRKLKTLKSSIASFFQPKPSESEVTELVEELQRRGTIIVSDGKVSYEEELIGSK